MVGEINERRREWLERQIAEARERGLFDDLEGRGAALPNLGEVEDPTWWGKQLIRRENLSVLPPAIEIRRKVEATLASLPDLVREQDVREALEGLNAEIRALNRCAAAGPPTTQAVLDVEARVAAWRADRARDQGEDEEPA